MFFDVLMYNYRNNQKERFRLYNMSCSWNAYVNQPMVLSPSYERVVAAPIQCSGIGSGPCPPSNLEAAAIARAQFVRGTNTCPNISLFSGQGCNVFGACNVNSPQFVVARAAGLGNPAVPNIVGFGPPLEQSPMVGTVQRNGLVLSSPTSHMQYLGANESCL